VLGACTTIKRSQIVPRWKITGVHFGLGGVLVRPSNLLISFSSFSAPLMSFAPLAPCLSKRYVRRFFFSSGRPSRRVKRCVSSLKTNWAPTMHVAADSRTTREVESTSAWIILDLASHPAKSYYMGVRTVVKVNLSLGNSSSKISAGNLSMNLPKAMRPNA